MQQLQTGSSPDSAQVYQPAEDSFLLLRAAIREVVPVDRVLEVGAGSGYVSSGLPVCKLGVGTDINPHAVRIARDAGVQMIRTDLGKGLRSGQFDLIIFNPPYLPTLPDDRIDDWLEYALDGGETGREVIARFLNEIPDILSPGGRILLLISSYTGYDQTLDLITASGLKGDLLEKEQVEGGEILYILRLTRAQ